MWGKDTRIQLLMRRADRSDPSYPAASLMPCNFLRDYS